MSAVTINTNTVETPVTITTAEEVINLTINIGGESGGGGGNGADGAAATIAAGTTTTGAEGSNASVVNSGTSSAAVFDFTIPRGDTGATGPQGIQGVPGVDGADGLSAYEVAVAGGFVGDETAWLASLVGADGAGGADGQGVPVGGATGEVLAKLSGTDYDTGWVEVAAGGGALTAFKIVDESIANSNTTVLDSDMQITVNANSYYEFNLVGKISGDSALDFAYGFQHPAGASVFWYPVTTPSSAGFDENRTYAVGTFPPPSFSIFTAFGLIKTGANSGVFGLKWAQNTSGAVASTLHEGSSLILHKLN